MITNGAKMKVILFDIDGTLLYDGGAGKTAMIQAFQEIFGVYYSFSTMAGKTDPAILLEGIEGHNIKEEAHKKEYFKKYYFKLLAKNIKQDLPEKRIFPGVVELLNQLNKFKDIRIGLLTGNWKKSAYVKLTYFGLERYFGFGAFGDDSIFRNDLLPLALKRCDKCGELTARDAIIIGDTPSDIKCALAHGSRSIGVATGRYPAQELIQNGADLVLKDLTEAGRIISFILSKNDYCKVPDLRIIPQQSEI